MSPYLDTIASDMASNVTETHTQLPGFHGPTDDPMNSHSTWATNGKPVVQLSSRAKTSKVVDGSTFHTLSKSQSKVADEEDVYDIVVAGFGPAALAIAIAMEDALEDSRGESLYDLPRKPRVVFLEKQHDFAWHAGMLIDGAKMQISFIKDLATLRNPKSRFTFLNYLHHKKRLVQFSNLNTFLPSRVEFEDYLRWCARHFDEIVSYGEEALDITPEIPGSDPSDTTGNIRRFLVRSRNVHTQRETIIKARHVIIAVGGSPKIPAPFERNQPRVIHSSQYIQRVPHLLSNRLEKYNVAVVGGGQSAAEVFDNLHHTYPNCTTSLIFRQAALKPSDDSPFVNEVFDPERIAPFYNQPSQWRTSTNMHHRNTNYGVVRLELLEKIYGTLYTQRLMYQSEDQWPHRIMPNATIENIAQQTAKKIKLDINWTSSCDPQDRRREDIEYDLVVLATGYSHNGHENMLLPLQNIAEKSGNHWTAGKDYRLQIDGLPISKDAGIWLQGCNEETHGLADTLLSTLSVRGGELVQSIFGEPA